MHWRVFIISACVAVGPVANAADYYLVGSYFSNKLGLYDSTGALVKNLNGPTLHGPQAIKKGPDGKIYVADEQNNRVLRYDGTTYDYLDTFVASGSGGLNGATGLGFDASGNLLVSSFNNDSVFRYQAGTGTYLSTIVPNGNHGLNGPDTGTTIGPDGKLYIPSFYSNQVLRYDASGNFIDSFVAANDHGLTGPRVLIWHGDYMYVSSETNSNVLRFNKNTGAYVDTFIPGGSGGLHAAVGMIFDRDGNLLVTSDTNKVLKFNGSTGAFMSNFITAGLSGPTYIAAVPEPKTLSVFGIGGALLIVKRRSKRRNP